MVSVVATGRGWRQPVFLLITGVLVFALVKGCRRVNQLFECYFIFCLGRTIDTPKLLETKSLLSTSGCNEACSSLLGSD